MSMPMPPLNLNTNQRSEQSGLTGGTASTGVTTGARVTPAGVPVVWIVAALALAGVFWLKSRRG